MRRVVVISHVYVNPANRGKLRALAARGVDVTIGVPEHWRDVALARTLEVRWERQNGLEIFPIGVRHHKHAERARFTRRVLTALLRDKRPAAVQGEEEAPPGRGRRAGRGARRLRLRVVLLSRQTAPLPLPLSPRLRRRRTLRRNSGSGRGTF